ncbi:hypothetical protein [Streptomyces sp. MJM8645]|uniref:hypothetical protein n=1 Tax=Streptomycetaceae TaxID=2062 RepID=UPI0007AEFEB1|nr:hypothetical protein [Streptomyces sp. MJM8645]
MYAITSPDGDHDETIAGVHFTAGRAAADELSYGALLYFRRHGYEVEQLDQDPAAEATGDGPAPPVTAKGRARAKE